MAVLLLPDHSESRRVGRRHRTFSSGTRSELGLQAASPTTAVGDVKRGHSAHDRNRASTSGSSAPPQWTAWTTKEEEEEGQSSDTDLEDEAVTETPCRQGTGSSSHVIYSAACRHYGVLPASQVLTALRSATVNVTNRNLSPPDAMSLACALLNNTEVTSLILRGNRIGPAGIRSVCGMMDENVYITTLDVSDNQLGHQGAVELGAMLRVNEELRVLNISGNNFLERDAAFIAEALQHNFRLVELNLSHNSLQEEGGVLIGKALTSTETLLSLDLSWNHLRLKGALALAYGLQHNSSLTHLNLSWNGFADVGARAISEALKENVTLVDLDLTSNRITAVGAKSLGEAIEVNSTLKALKLGLNPLSSVGAVKVLEAVRRNEGTALTVLDMKGTAVTLEFEALVNELRKSRANIAITRDLVVNSHDHVATLTSRPSDVIIADPVDTFMVHVQLRKLRLWDCFVRIDVTFTLKVTRSQFTQVVQASRIPMSRTEMGKIIEYLDPSNEDSIDYGRLLRLDKDAVLKARRQIVLAHTGNKRTQ